MLTVEPIDSIVHGNVLVERWYHGHFIFGLFAISWHIWEIRHPKCHGMPYQCRMHQSTARFPCRMSTCNLIYLCMFCHGTKDKAFWEMVIRIDPLYGNFIMRTKWSAGLNLEQFVQAQKGHSAWCCPSGMVRPSCYCFSPCFNELKSFRQNTRMTHRDVCQKYVALFSILLFFCWGIPGKIFIGCTISPLYCRYLPVEMHSKHFLRKL
jgi:hypothetical protein